VVSLAPMLNPSLRFLLTLILFISATPALAGETFRALTYNLWGCRRHFQKILSPESMAFVATSKRKPPKTAGTSSSFKKFGALGLPNASKTVAMNTQSGSIRGPERLGS